MNEARKASDILLELETKIDILGKEQKTLALSINVLSNKLTKIIEIMNTKSTTSTSDTDFQESISDTAVPINNEHTVVAEDFSKRTDYVRTQRSEAFDSVKTPQSKQSSSKQNTNVNAGNKVAIQQRMVDSSGKAIYLANVEIINKNTNTIVHKGRTDGVGKWNASLLPGEYLVRATKSESKDKPKLDVSQNLVVDGAHNTLNLPVMIVK